METIARETINGLEHLVIDRSRELNTVVFINKDPLELDKLLAKEITYGHITLHQHQTMLQEL